VQFDLGAIYRVDAFRVTGTKGSTLGATAQAKHVKLLWAHVPTALDDAWNVAGDLELPFDSKVVNSVRFKASKARHWLIEAVSNWEDYKNYPFSNVMELELFACPDSDSDRIILSGMTGSLTPDNSKEALINIDTETPSSLLPTALWTQLTGELTVTLDYVAKAFDEIIFSFLLKADPDNLPQPPRTVCNDTNKGRAKHTR
jgi:hypothetical protein